MIWTIYAVSLVVLAGLPAVMMLQNLRLFTRATEDPDLVQLGRSENVSVLIPARNEEASIRPALESILRYGNPSLEVLVQDDCSEDATAAIVREIATVDSRVRLIDAIPLPEGWNGKQHACWRLAKSASHPWLLFVDADVRFSEDAIPRMIAHAKRQDVELLSGFPFQETKTLAEKMLIPLMHFVLLGYLPIREMRKSTSTGFSAGCGQLMLARSKGYWLCDGHSAIRSSRHDGIQLPRAFRTQSMRTDIFDAGDIARCRMYTNCREVVRGLMKNATEGMASNRLIVLFSILLAGAAVMPLMSLIILLFSHVEASLLVWFCVVLATGLSWVPRVLAAKQFSQSWLGTFLHPLSVAWFLQIQWAAWLQRLFGLRVLWRGRS
jgi:hypothetical protein